LRLLIIPLFLFLLGCQDDDGNIYENIPSKVDMNNPPHPNPTSTSEEFPPKPPQI
jgi:hypothetical protein